jgi:hypothetical protein
MPIDARYDNPATMKEKRETLAQDRTATTYLDQARSSVGAEMGGRFSHLSKDQQIVGDRNIHLPGQRPEGHWGGGFREGDEMPLGVDVNALPDMTTVDGSPRAEPIPEELPTPQTEIVIEELTRDGFRRRKF